MNPYYFYNFPTHPRYFTDFASEVILLVLTGIFLVVLLASLAIYCVESLSYYRIVKNRGYSKPWLIWIPFARTYLKCSLADDILIKTGRKPFLGKISLVLIGIMLLFVVFSIAIYPISWNLSLFSIISFGIASLAGLALSVISYIALFYFYEDYQNNFSVVFLIMTIFFSFTEPVVVFLSRNKQPRSLGGR